uniref:Response regulatory domain-containing protein n=1 Tax=Palpitomonas bilix TaxID=652834 RepID=A0A7S3GM33_9EUKA
MLRILLSSVRDWHTMDKGKKCTVVLLCRLTFNIASVIDDIRPIQGSFEIVVMNKPFQYEEVAGVLLAPSLAKLSKNPSMERAGGLPDVPSLTRYGSVLQAKSIKIIVADDDHVSRGLLARMLSKIPLVQDATVVAVKDGEDVLCHLGLLNKEEFDEMHVAPSTAVPSNEEISAMVKPLCRVDGPTCLRKPPGFLTKRVSEYLAVIVDGQMERVGGVEVAERIREAGLRIPVMVVSGACMEFERQEYLDSGANSVLGKPFTKGTLAEQMEALGMRSRLDELQAEYEKESRNGFLLEPRPSMQLPNLQGVPSIILGDEDNSEKITPGLPRQSTTSYSRGSLSNEPAKPLALHLPKLEINGRTNVSTHNNDVAGSRSPLANAKVEDKAIWYADAMQSMEGLAPASKKQLAPVQHSSPSPIHGEHMTSVKVVANLVDHAEREQEEGKEISRTSSASAAVSSERMDGTVTETEVEPIRNECQHELDQLQSSSSRRRKLHASAKLDGPRDDGRPRRMMIVDDDRLCRLLATKMFKSKGFECVSAPDGEDCMEILENDETPFDFILMDCHMERMDGYTATREIRSRMWPHKKVIVIGGTAGGSAEACFAAGMDEVVFKPFKVADILQRVQLAAKKRGVAV